MANCAYRERLCFPAIPFFRACVGEGIVSIFGMPQEECSLILVGFGSFCGGLFWRVGEVYWCTWRAIWSVLVEWRY